MKGDSTAMFNASSKMGRLLRAAMPVTPGQITPPRINVLITQAVPHHLNMAGGPV